MPSTLEKVPSNPPYKRNLIYVFSLRFDQFTLNSIHRTGRSIRNCPALFCLCHITLTFTFSVFLHLVFHYHLQLTDETIELLWDFQDYLVLL